MLLAKSFKYSLYILLPFILAACGGQAEQEMKAPSAIHVDTLTISPVSIRLSKELPGRIAAFKKAEVRPQVSGILKSRLYKEGKMVEAGDVLYEIDPTTYQSAVNSAKAQLAKALANEATTKRSALRYKELLQQNLASKLLYDEAESVYEQAKAEVAIRQAELDNANVQLSYTKVKAPISGQIGISSVSEGSLLTAEQSSYLTTIIQTNDVYVDMQQPSVSLYKIRQSFQHLRGSDSFLIPVSITLEDGTPYELTGHLEFADTQVTGSTGTVTLRAIIPNPNNTLLAGMYVRAHISMPEERDYLVVPQSAVVRSQSGQPSLFVVNEENKTVKKEVVLGKEVGNGWIVEKGINAGDKVVISNLIRVRNNLEVIIDTDTDTNSISQKDLSQSVEQG
ncbi:efflux RND transporter periplasmic adaptor subunit [Pseudocolwellia sp. AS88]|uniref:efflux RND transporter periplasmic adaptor subunit n=1 Tax=Pseudocolwellia sp. AS88 TaxID=3063958 RepID=UPI0026EF3F11|nr:efflux RND transporter periplasmic adaptor subunit [Pseudocolwellia sp. AS88]MDO7084221.1 efflux RND transporter periplasmic adaptor subunit [Pseudocolwellia sp. AS88]